MSHLRVCRICLQIDGKMYDYNRFKLKLFYEELMAIEVDKNSDYLPHYFCIECATMLHKFHKFKEKCNTGQNTLEALMWGNTLPLKSIEDVDRKSKNLISPLSVDSKTTKVFNYAYDTIISPTETVIVKMETNDTHQLNTISFQDDNSLDDVKDDFIPSDMEIFVEEPKIIKIEPDPVLETTTKNTSVDKNDQKSMKQENNDDSNTNRDSSDISYSRKKNKKQKATHKHKLTKRKKTKAQKTETKVVKTNKDELDPNHWLTVTFTEKEALEEFAARAQDSRYFAAEYKCNKCMKGFSREDMLKRHDKVRHNEAIKPCHICHICNMTFGRKNYLSRHMLEHYKKYKCLRCNVVFNGNPRVALRHEDLHSGVVRKCEYCEKEFRHLNTYNAHIRLIHRSEHVCTLCGASFKNNYGLFYHRKVAHRFEDTDMVEGESQYCERCDIKFETRKAYVEHFANSAKHDDVKISEENSSQLLKTKRLIRSTRDYSRGTLNVDCHICGKHFHSQKSYLKHHQAEHPGTAKFAPHQCLVCEICGKSVYPNKMKQHVMAHGDSPYAPVTCPVCHKKYSNAYNFRNHYRNQHETDEKANGDSSNGPVACPVCHKKYTNAYNMRNHYRTQHETDPAKKIEKSKSFTCDVCGVVMSQKSNLIRHIRIHTGELPYECEVCGRRFRNGSSKKVHYRTVHLKEPHPKRKPRSKGVAKKKAFYQGGNEDDSKGSIHLYLQ